DFGRHGGNTAVVEDHLALYQVGDGFLNAVQVALVPDVAHGLDDVEATTIPLTDARGQSTGAGFQQQGVGEDLGDVRLVGQFQRQQDHGSRSGQVGFVGIDTHNAELVEADRGIAGDFLIRAEHFVHVLDELGQIFACRSTTHRTSQSPVQITDGTGTDVARVAGRRGLRSRLLDRLTLTQHSFVDLGGAVVFVDIKCHGIALRYVYFKVCCVGAFE